MSGIQFVVRSKLFPGNLTEASTLWYHPCALSAYEKRENGSPFMYYLPMNREARSDASRITFYVSRSGSKAHIGPGSF